MKYEKPEVTVLAHAIGAIQASKEGGTKDSECPGHPNNDLLTDCTFPLDE